MPRYLTPLPLAVAVRETSDAVTAPPKSSRSSASACALAVPSREDVDTLTKPSPSTIPFGELGRDARARRLAAGRLDRRHAAERSPEITAADAFAGAWAGAADTSVAAATATATTAPRSRMRTF